MRRQLEYVVDTSQFRHSLDGHFQAGDTIITIGTFLQRFSKKSVKTGSPNRPALSLNLTFRSIWKNHVCKVPIDCSTCPGFIYQPQKSIIFRTERRTEDGNISLAAPTNVRSASRNYEFGTFSGNFALFSPAAAIVCLL